MKVSVTVDKRAVDRMLKGIEVKSKDVRKGWQVFQQYMRVRTDQTFEKLRHGGSFRGVRWKYFAPQYKRKDGTVVPAWGGIPKVRGGGMVQGRRRASGALLKKGDSIVQDTETLRKSAAMVQRQTGDVLELGPGGLIYAAYQQRMRPFLFFETPKDLTQLTKIMVTEIRKSAKGR